MYVISFLHPFLLVLIFMTSFPLAMPLCCDAEYRESYEDKQKCEDRVPDGAVLLFALDKLIMHHSKLKKKFLIGYGDDYQPCEDNVM